MNGKGVRQLSIEAMLCSLSLFPQRTSSQADLMAWKRKQMDDPTQERTAVPLTRGHQEGALNGRSVTHFAIALQPVCLMCALH